MNRRKDQKLHPFGERAGDDGGGGGHEHHLEEPVGHRGIAVVDDGPGRRRLRRIVRGVQQLHLFAGRSVEQRERAEPAALVHPDIHDVVADQVEHQAGDRVQADILEADDGRVLGADGARFQHREPAHIHITSAPQIRNEKLFRTNCVSSPTAARAWPGRRSRTAVAAATASGAAAGARFVRCRRGRSRVPLRGEPADA